MGTSDASTEFLHRITRAAGSLASSIRTKIVLPYAVLTLAVAAVGTFVVTQLVASSLEERFVNQLVDSGGAVAAFSFCPALAYQNTGDPLQPDDRHRDEAEMAERIRRSTG